MKDTNIYLMYIVTVNDIEIKQRYGEEFRRAHRVQKMPNYVAVYGGQILGERNTLKQIMDFAHEQTRLSKGAPALLHAAIDLLREWGKGNLTSKVARQLEDAVDDIRGEE